MKDGTESKKALSLRSLGWSLIYMCLPNDREDEKYSEPGALVHSPLDLSTLSLPPKNKYPPLLWCAVGDIRLGGGMLAGSRAVDRPPCSVEVGIGILEDLRILIEDIGYE